MAGSLVSQAGMECACCCQVRNQERLRPCSKGHVVCADCKRRANRSDCLYCAPLNPTTAAPQRNAPRSTPPRAAPRSTPPRASSRRGGRSRCIAACERVQSGVQVLLTAALSFVVAVYAGKVYVWLYMRTQDKEVAWFAWGSFRHCIQESLLGFFGSALLLGCCCVPRE
jgi:hypothetical protein